MLAWLGEYVVKIANLAEAEGRLVRHGLVDLALVLSALAFACLLGLVCLLLALGGIWWSLSIHVSGAAALALTSVTAGLMAVLAAWVFARLRHQRL